MIRSLTALAVFAVLAGCDGENPFMPDVVVDPITGAAETLEPGDPNVSVNNRFAYDTGQNLTLNAVSYDDNGTPGNTSDDALVINNLPFDGPDGRYLEAEVLANGATVYASQQTQTTGTTQTYAVFIRADNVDVTSAGSGQWNGFGYSGANINRDSFALPGGIGEYIYTGNYAATRTFSDRGGIEIISGQLNLRLDELDFDNDGTFEGALDGNITNRQREGAAGALGLGGLPPIVLAVTRYNPDTGVWEGGTASTYLDNGDIRASGTHDGLLAGPNGDEVGGYSIITGAADVQRVDYQVVNFTVTSTAPVLDGLGNPVLDLNGDPIEIITITPGVSSGLDGVSTEDLQNQIDARQNVQDYFGAQAVPTGPNVTITSDVTLTFDLTTSYDAREVGVFAGDQVVPIP
ncbi:MAG: hypothetical protein ABF254_10605 [Octadecabacter sp.]